MKHPYLAKLLFLLLLAVVGFPSGAFAQTGSISGRVTDSKNQGIPGSTVLIEGTTLGSSSNVDGTYNLPSVPAGPQTLVISFIGYNTVRRPVTVVAGQNIEVSAGLTENATQLSEAVVVGYGTQRRQDVTGAVTQLDTKQFVRGQITNPEQLIQGKVAGVNITTNGGQPGDGAQIRIRGGSSINANNDPLLIIDGVPVETGGLKGGNPLALINPNDIESYTVLKDASATAIYGSRAAAGVILITTKKGLRDEPLRVNFSTQFSVAQRAQKLKVLNGDEFRALIQSQKYRAAINDTSRDVTLQFRRDTLLGTANTDWQKEIFRTAYTFDNNVSLTGSAGKVPFRVSYGNLNQQGIVRTSELVRNTLSVGVSPTFFNNRLRVDINLKGAIAKNRFPDGGAVGGAVTFDPTRPVRDPAAEFQPFGGYFEFLNGSTPNTLSPTNPVSLLNSRNDRSTVQRSIGNIQFDLKIPGVEGLRANYNLGYDLQRGDQTTIVDPLSRPGYRSLSRAGLNGTTTISSQNRNTWLNEFYLAYNHDFDKAGRIDVVAGYSYQNFFRKNPFDQPFSSNNAPVAGTAINADIPYFKAQYALQSYYGRVNYAFRNRYLLTATLRADQSSRFAPKYRTGYFPAVGLGYRLKEESFLRDVAIISELKLRASYGQTGQQDIGTDFAAYYGFKPVYTFGNPTASYPFGSNAITTIRPEGYIGDRRWETTTTYDFGLDYGFGSNGRFSGTLDFYQKRSTNLLFFGDLAAGSNLTNQGTYNIGTFDNRGVEFALNTLVIKNDKLSWNLNFNATYNKSNVVSTTGTNQLTGDISGIGNQIQVIAGGYPIRTFYVYQQKYDDKGNPISPAGTSATQLLAAYVDQNGDGKIDTNDRVPINLQADPKVLLGLSSNLNVKDFFFNFTLRSNQGGSVYNNVASQLGSYNSLYSSGNAFRNTTADLGNAVTFRDQQLFSSYFVQSSRFIRMENITVGYTFNKLMNNAARSVSVSLAVQNAFIITPYKGLDPETQGGIDNNYYPRPRTYTLGLNFGF